MSEPVKQYVVMMGAEIMFGPETDYTKVQAFTNSLAPAIKGKCTVKVVKKSAEAPVEGAEAPKTAVQAEKPAAVAKQPAPAKTQKPSAPDNPNSAFGQYLEGAGQSDFWKPKDGRNIIRILPIGGVLPTDWTTPYPFVLSGVHPNVGLSLRDTIYCARLTHNKACPICQFVWKLWNGKDENDIKLAKRIKAYNRVIANIIDLSDVDKGVQKFAFGKTLARKIMSYIEDPEFQPLLDAEKGHNFIVIKKMVDNYPNYDDSRPEVRVSSATEIYPDWKKECFDLKKEVIEKDYEQLMSVLSETKKAILSTDISEFNAPVGTQTKKKTEPAESGEVIEEVDLNSISERLGQL